MDDILTIVNEYWDGPMPLHVIMTRFVSRNEFMYKLQLTKLCRDYYYFGIKEDHYFLGEFDPYFPPLLKYLLVFDRDGRILRGDFESFLTSSM